MRRAGTTVERLLPSDAHLSASVSIESFSSISEWDDASETSTISRDEEQGIGRVAWHFMRFAGAKIEIFAGFSKPVLPRVRVEMKTPAWVVGVEHKLREDRKMTHNEYKILILGGSGVGKSTVVKQMKIQYGGSYSPTERESFKPIIRSHSIRSLQSVIAILRRAGHQHCLDNNKYANTVMRIGDSEHIQLFVSTLPACEISIAMSSICQDTAIKLAISRLPKFEFGDSALYFFHAADRVFAASYLPTNEDILCCPETTPNSNGTVSFGSTETKVSCGTDTLRLCDLDVSAIGPRSKWIPTLSDVNALIFAVSLSDYDQKLDKDPSINRMDATFKLFESISSSQWFARAYGIIIFLNKMDIFREKLPHSPLSAHFPDYEGKNEAKEASEYLSQRFKKLAKHTFYSQRTILAEASNSLKFVPTAVKDMALRNNIKFLQLM